MTNNQSQPSENQAAARERSVRVWLEFFEGNVRGVSVYVPEWYDGSPLSCRLNRIRENGVKYIRVDGNCVHKTCPRPADCHYYCMDRHAETCVASRQNQPEQPSDKCEHGILWSTECLSCGHSDFIRADLLQQPATSERCDVSVTGKHRVDSYCKDCGQQFSCVYSATGAHVFVSVSKSVPCETCGLIYSASVHHVAATGAGEEEGRDGVAIIGAERRRHFEVEGWTPEHDDEHTLGEMAVAAACYAVAHTDAKVSYPDDDPEGSGWPWGTEWFKPKDDVRNLARAGALIAAEIDRLRRAATPPAPSAAGPQYCPTCSKAGGVEWPVYHAPPMCIPAKPATEIPKYSCAHCLPVQCGCPCHTPSTATTSEAAREAARIASKDNNEQAISFEDNLRWLDEQVTAGWPTEEDAEAILREHGTSGREVTNAFIDQLLRERQQFKDQLELLDDPDGLYSEARSRIEADARANAIREAVDKVWSLKDGGAIDMTTGLMVNNPDGCWFTQSEIATALQELGTTNVS